MNNLIDTPRQLLVFIHGWSCRASDWDDTLTALKPALNNFHSVVTPCLPGHAGAEEEALDEWTIPALARALLAKLDPGEQDQLTLVGHSMGGCVALEVAALLGTQAKTVILADTFGLPYGDMDESTVESIEQPFCADFVAAMHSLVDNTTPPSLAEAQRDWIKARMASANPKTMLPIWHNLLRWSPDKAFSEIQCPIYAINGEHIPAPAQIRCATAVKSQVIVGAHHFPQFEQPQDFQQALLALLTR